MRYLFIYFAAVNILAFSVYGLDKYKARSRQWRISESALLFLAVIGGSLGAFAAMKIFHHKIRKAKFTVGIPVVIFIQILGMVRYFSS